MKAQNSHRLHSPYLYHFYNQVLDNVTNRQVIKRVLDYKSSLHSNNAIIQKTELGGKTNRELSVSEMARTSSVRNSNGKLLHRIVDFHKPTSILELGSCLGVSAAWMLSARFDQKINFTSIEGCPQTFNSLKDTWTQSAFNQVYPFQEHFVLSSFEQYFNRLTEDHHFDLVFMDGNHRYEPTLAYFKQLLPHLHNKSLVIFDDIYWSAEMTKAWTEIKNFNEVSFSIDLFQFGIIGFSERQKEHFTLRFVP